MSNANTDGRRAETVASATGYAALFERTPDPMVAVDCDDVPTLRVANAAYHRTFGGYAVDDATPIRTRDDLAGPERSVVRTAAAGDVGSDVVTKRTPDGHRTFALQAIPASQAGVTAFVRYRDVTVRRVRDQQLAVLRRVLRHDLRNDLTVVLGYARTLAESADDPRTRAAAETIVRAAGDLRSVSESAGRLETVITPSEPTALGDALARVRRDVADALDGDVVVETASSEVPVDSRLGVALEELCRTLLDHGGATTIHLEGNLDEREARVVVETDATLSEQQTAALEGRAETQLRHATGMSPWMARWAIRGAGGTLRLARADRGRTRIALSVPRLEGEANCDEFDDVWIAD